MSYPSYKETDNKYTKGKSNRKKTIKPLMEKAILVVIGFSILLAMLLILFL